jgi:prevent-host-death family protein
MTPRKIPQRELRNNVGGILREAEGGTEFTITVRGRAVARLGPLDENERRRVNVPTDALRARLEATPIDAGYATDVSRLRELEAPAEDPWPSR